MGSPGGNVLDDDEEAGGMRGEKEELLVLREGLEDLTALVGFAS